MYAVSNLLESSWGKFYIVCTHFVSLFRDKCWTRVRWRSSKSPSDGIQDSSKRSVMTKLCSYRCSCCYVFHIIFVYFIFVFFSCMAIVNCGCTTRNGFVWLKIVRQEHRVLYTYSDFSQSPSQLLTMYCIICFICRLLHRNSFDFYWDQNSFKISSSFCHDGCWG